MENDSSVIVKKIIVILLTVLIIFYIVSVGLKANFTQIKTESANVMTVSDSVAATGFFIRDENIITYKGDGVISYLLDDGDKISKNEAVANVYSDTESANDKRNIDKLEQQIANLKQLESTAETISLSPDDIDKNISSSLSKARISSSERNFTDADKNYMAALYSINQRQMVTGKIKDFSGKISQLQKKLSTLKKKNLKSSPVLSPKTGYFSSNVDGYENYFTSEDVEKIKVGDLDEKKFTKKSVDGSVIGKTIEGVYWYIACEVSAEDAIGIKESDGLAVNIPIINSGNISVELHSIQQETKTSPAVVILKGSYMSSDVIKLRHEDISIVKNTYEGIYVSRNAVHEQHFEETVTDKNGKKKKETKTVKGVYILIGNELVFKQIVPIYTGQGFIICKREPEEKDLATDQVGVLKAYDDVVVEGANLYDGKIIDRTNA